LMHPYWLSVHAIAFSPDGKTILTGCGQHGGKGEAWLWDVATRRPRGPALQHPFSVQQVAFSPNGKVILTRTVNDYISTDSETRFGELATGTPIGSPIKQQGYAPIYLPCVFSPDSKTLFAVSDEKTSRLWDVTTSKPLEPVLQHESALRAGAFSPDGKAV